MNQAVEELEGTYARIDDLEKVNLWLDTETREARNARRRAEDLQTDEARKATAALKALEDYKAANPPYSQVVLDEASRACIVDSPLKSKRKAHRSVVHQDGRNVQNSQSQRLPELSPLRPVTPRSSINVFNEQFEEDDQPLDDLASLFPPTPDLSSRIERPTTESDLDSPFGHPRSILKASKSTKRSAEAAGLPTAEREPRLGRGLHVETQSLGPVIPESQSQNDSQSHTRSHRLLRLAASKPKGDSFMSFEGTC